MGLSLKLSMFYSVGPGDVYRQYQAFYAGVGRPLMETGEEGYEHDVHDVNGGWTIISHGIGWHWDERRAAQHYVSAALACVSLLAFVYDGDFWGYELVRGGVVLDQFVQDGDLDSGDYWFPGRPIAGNPEVLASQFPWLRVASIAPYLIRPVYSNAPPGSDLKVEDAHYFAERERWDMKVRPGDEFTRLDECAVLDFLRVLRVEVGLSERQGLPGRYVTLATPVRYRYWTHK